MSHTTEFELQTSSLEYISTYLDASGPAAGRTVGKEGILLVLRVLILIYQTRISVGSVIR